jgi:hypothetical protein
VWGKKTQFTCRLGAVVAPLCRGGWSEESRREARGTALWLRLAPGRVQSTALTARSTPSVRTRSAGGSLVDRAHAIAAMTAAVRPSSRREKARRTPPTARLDRPETTRSYTSVTGCASSRAARYARLVGSGRVHLGRGGLDAPASHSQRQASVGLSQRRRRSPRLDQNQRGLREQPHSQPDSLASVRIRLSCSVASVEPREQYGQDRFKSDSRTALSSPLHVRLGECAWQSQGWRSTRPSATVI